MAVNVIIDGREVCAHIEKTYASESEQAAHQMALQLVAHYMSRVNLCCAGVPALVVNFAEDDVLSDLAKKYRWDAQVREAAQKQLRLRFWKMELHLGTRRLHDYLIQPLAK
jgi:hypothetical protein